MSWEAGGKETGNTQSAHSKGTSAQSPGEPGRRCPGCPPRAHTRKPWREEKAGHGRGARRIKLGSLQICPGLQLNLLRAAVNSEGRSQGKGFSSGFPAAPPESQPPLTHRLPPRGLPGQQCSTQGYRFRRWGEKHWFFLTREDKVTLHCSSPAQIEPCVCCFHGFGGRNKNSLLFSYLICIVHRRQRTALRTRGVLCLAEAPTPWG